MLILLIEDEPGPILEQLQDECEAAIGERPRIEVETDFSAARARVSVISPDVIVLDLLAHGPGAGNPEGIDVLNEIWDERFSPIIVHSAESERAEGLIDTSHPFVEIVKKSRRSIRQVAKFIKAFSTHIAALNETEKSIRATMHQTLKTVAPMVFSQAKPEERSAMLVRAAKRRIAASIDESETGSESVLRSWEHFVFPPISESVMTGDLLRRMDGDPSDARSYYVVLTPSCDMVATGDRSPKVSNVLTAECFEPLRVLSAVNLTNESSKSKAKDKLKPVLSRGFEGWAMPMPELPGILPAMTVDFRRLTLIPITSIGASDKDYLRVAAVDSPFRELVTWAYMQSTGRPGLPDRDFNEWAASITDLMGATQE